MTAPVARTRKLRWWHVATAFVVLLIGASVFLFVGSDVDTFRVRYQGQLCTEYKDIKQGVPMHVVCPSTGHESWIDTLRQKKYPRSVPVEYLDQPSNER
jgi:hypothetical protein